MYIVYTWRITGQEHSRTRITTIKFQNMAVCVRKCQIFGLSLSEQIYYCYVYIPLNYNFCKLQFTLLILEINKNTFKWNQGIAVC